MQGSSANRRRSLSAVWPWHWHWTLFKAVASVALLGLFYVLSFLVVVLYSLPINEARTYVLIRTAYFPLVLLLEFIVRP